MSPWALVSLSSMLVLLGLCVFVYRRPPPGPFWPTVFFALLFPLIFNTGNFLLYFSAGPFWSWAFLALTYTGLIFFAPVNFILVHRFSEALGKSFPWARSNWVWAPLGIAFLFWLAMITNPWHELFLVHHINKRSDFQILWFAHTIFAYTLTFTVFGLYVRILGSAKSLQVRFRVFIMLSSLIALAGNALFFITPLDIPFDPTTVGFTIASCLYVLGTYPTRAYPTLPFALTAIARRQSLGLITTNNQGHITFWNEAAEQALGESLNNVDESIFGWLAQRLAPPPSSSSSRLEESELRQLLLETSDTPTSTAFHLRDNPDKWVRLASSSNCGRDSSRIQSYSFRIEDYTQEQLSNLAHKREQNEVATRQRQEGLSVLAGGIAHDYNNLLMTIQGNVELSLVEPNLPPSVQRRLEVVGTATRHASRLTQQLLTYAGRSTPRTAPLDPEQLLADIRELAEAVVKARGLTLHVAAEPGLIINADQGQIEQVVMNLTVNAAEASGAGASLYLSAGACNQEGTPNQGQPGNRATHAYIAVRDEGSGMDKVTRERIFDPFFSTKEDNRGLGLAAVRGIVHSHNGTLFVDSEVNQGTEMKIVLPLFDGEAGMAKRADVAIEQDGLRVLIVEDEPTIRELYGAMLATEGCSVQFAEPGVSAMSLFEELAAEIDLVLLDIAMPEVDGLSLFKHYRAIKPELRIVFASGHPPSVLPTQVTEASGVQHLDKPFTSQQLIRAINVVTREQHQVVT